MSKLPVFDDHSYESLKNIKEKGEFSSMGTAVKELSEILQDQVAEGFSEVVLRNPRTNQEKTSIMLSLVVTKETTSICTPIHNDRYPWCLIDENGNVIVLCASVNIAEQIRNPHVNRLDTSNWFNNGWMDGFSIISSKPNNSPVALCTSNAIRAQILNSLK